MSLQRWGARRADRGTVTAADMVGILLKQLDLLLDARDSGRVVTDAEAAQIREHSAIWHQQLEKLRSRLTGLTIEPPRRVQ